MKTSKFAFSDPCLTRLYFCINENFSREDGSIQIPVNINVSRSMHEDGLSAKVELEATIGEENEKMPFYIKVAYAALFNWEECTFDEKDVETLLTKNAPALLLGYLRPAVANITNFSRYPAYNLPFMDLTAND